MWLITIKDVLPAEAVLEQINVKERVIELYYTVYRQNWVAIVFPDGKVEYEEYF